MKNKSILIFVSLFGLLTGCSNGANFNWRKYETYSSSINLKSKKYESFDTSFNYDYFLTSMSNATSDLVKEKPANSVVKSFNVVVAQQNELSLKTQFLETEYYGNPTEENYNALQKAKSNLSLFSTWYIGYLVKASTCGEDIKKAFFGNKTDDEIQEYLSNLVSTPATAEIQNKIDNLSNQGQLLSSRHKNGEIDDNDYEIGMLRLLISISEYEHEMEEILGVDDYLNYIYKNTYRRSYKRNVVPLIGDYIKQYAINYLDNYNLPESLKNPDPRELNWALGLQSVSICSKIYFTGDALNEHANRMGGDFLNNYNHVWNDGYYYFSNNENCLGTASTSFPISSINDSILFFGNKYQSSTTVEHEFGHYNALRSNANNTTLSYDTLEIHSQANEFLFIDSLTKYCEHSDHKIGSYLFADLYYRQRATTLLNLISTSLVENYVFDNYSSSFDELLQGVRLITSSLSNYCDRTYWAYGAVCSPGYYISYVTSLISSLEIGCQAAQNFDSAKNNYFNLVNYSGTAEDFNSNLSNWNLHSPLNEDAYQFVFSNIPVYQ